MTRSRIILATLALSLALAVVVARHPQGRPLAPVALMTFAVAAFTRPLC